MTGTVGSRPKLSSTRSDRQRQVGLVGRRRHHVVVPRRTWQGPSAAAVPQCGMVAGTANEVEDVPHSASARSSRAFAVFPLEAILVLMARCRIFPAGVYKQVGRTRLVHDWPNLVTRSAPDLLRREFTAPAPADSMRRWLLPFPWQFQLADGLHSCRGQAPVQPGRSGSPAEGVCPAGSGRLEPLTPGGQQPVSVSDCESRRRGGRS